MPSSSPAPVYMYIFSFMCWRMVCVCVVCVCVFVFRAFGCGDLRIWNASVEDKEFKNHELVVTATFSVPSNEESRVCHHTLACFARFDCVCVCVCV
mmetsp:Transcript_90659/g.132610  ORF Transcript_90659/g.132610 Transcript_90659/m.132610 type:complete len:96 (+) Transcript_90659:1315-1602(+)